MEATVMSEADEMRLDCVSEPLMVALFYGSRFTAPWSGAKLVPEHGELQPRRNHVRDPHPEGRGGARPFTHFNTGGKSQI